MSDVLARIQQGELPENAKKAVVKGIVPLEAEELLAAIFYICGNDETLLAEARETVSGLPDGVKKTFFEAKTVDADITDFYLRHMPLPEDVKSVMLLNPGTRGSSIAAVAEDLEDRLLDLVVNNQVKILEEPTIIDNLRENPFLSINQKQRLEEYERLLLKNQVSSAEELENKDPKEIEAEAIAATKEFVAAFGKETGGPVRSAEAPPMPKPVKKEAPSADKQSANDPAAQQKEKISVLEQIAGMSVPQKIQAAIKGDREVRSILIRDSNKLVCCAVIKSPRITDSEVEFYANLRNVQTDVLRLIAQNREWTKNYKVVFSLVKNPRTPLTFTTKLLTRLNKKDLRGLVRDRGVPEVLRTMARRMTRTGA